MPRWTSEQWEEDHKRREAVAGTARPWIESKLCTAELFTPDVIGERRILHQAYHSGNLYNNLLDGYQTIEGSLIPSTHALFAAVEGLFERYGGVWAIINDNDDAGWISVDSVWTTTAGNRGWPFEAFNTYPAEQSGTGFLLFLCLDYKAGLVFTNGVISREQRRTYYRGFEAAFYGAKERADEFVTLMANAPPRPW